MSDPSKPEKGKTDDETIVTGDADWKAKVQREKEELEEKMGGQGRPELPPASFLGLVEELSLRSMIALGQMPNPLTGSQHSDLEAAHYTIDLLGILEEKTRGNLEADEASALTDVVSQLRSAFVHVKQHGSGAASESEEPEEPAGPKLIV